MFNTSKSLSPHANGSIGSRATDHEYLSLHVHMQSSIQMPISISRTRSAIITVRADVQNGLFGLALKRARGSEFQLALPHDRRGYEQFHSHTPQALIGSLP